MNPGGEPERDDTGLPPVDIEIPDDARELDRDVQAYYRELRAVRRRQRRTRWHRSLGRDGIVLPLLACCLILALITGTLLTVFTATSNQNLTGLPGTSPTRTGPGSARPGSSSAAASGGPALPHTVTAGRLPNAEIAVDGRQPQQVSTLRGVMLVLVPPTCSCGDTLGWLADAASTAHAQAYVIYSAATKTEVYQLYRQLDVKLRNGTVALAQETDRLNLLTSPATVPRDIQAGQLTAIMVSPDGTATWASQLSASENAAPLVHAITG